METCKPKCSLTPWFDEQCIRWDKKSIFGLRHAAFQAGLGIIRKESVKFSVSMGKILL